MTLQSSKVNPLFLQSCLCIVSKRSGWRHSSRQLLALSLCFPLINANATVPNDATAHNLVPDVSALSQQARVMPWVTTKDIQSWIPIAQEESIAEALQPIYQLMFEGKYVSAEEHLAKLYATKPEVLPQWLSLLAELHQFDKIQQLVANGSVASTHNYAVIANLYHQQSMPDVAFVQPQGEVALETHWLVALPRVRLNINGQWFYFVLDTGASQSLITDRVAKAAHINAMSAQTVQIDTATDQQVSAHVAILPELKLGPVLAKQQTMLIVDRAELEQTFLGMNWYRIDGIIGWPILKQLDLTFDFSAHRLEIRQPQTKMRAQAGNLVWLFDDPMVITRSPEKTRLWFLDTGAGETVLTANYLTLAQHQDLSLDAKQFGGLGGKGKTEQISQLGPIKISFPSLTTEWEQLTIRLEHNDCVQSRCDGRMGVDVASHGRMRINFSEAFFDVQPAH